MYKDTSLKKTERSLISQEVRMKNGCMGKVLWVDLSRNKIREEPIPEAHVPEIPVRDRTGVKTSL